MVNRLRKEAFAGLVWACFALLANEAVWAAAACGTSTSCGSSKHTITLQNNCSYPIWQANAANVVGGSVIGGKACTAVSDCCVTLPDGTSNCSGVNCAGGFCSQINCTKNSDCPSSSSGLVACNVPQGVQCDSDADCAAITCTTNSDCPPNATCSNSICSGICQSNVCACKSGGPACPGAGTTCDVKSGTSFGFCAGGACQYNGLIPESAGGSPQWKIDPGASATLCMPAGWGGRVWGRTGCSKAGAAFQCQTGQCGTGSTAALACTNLTEGVAQTATGVTLFEGTWDSNSTDFWDVSLVNGYNVGMQVSACGASGAASCTFAGQASSATAVGCTSDLTGTCPTLLQIAGQCNCSKGSDCPQGETCGSNNLCSGSASCTVACIDPGDYCKGFGLFGNQTTLPPPACLSCGSAVSSLNSTTGSDYYNCVGPLSTLSCNNAAYTCFSDSDCAYSGQTCQNNVCSPVNAVNNLAQCVNNACNSKVNQVSQYSCQTPPGGTPLCLPNAPTSTAQSGCCGPYNSGWLNAMQAANGSVASGTCQPGTTTYTEAFKNACPTAYSYQFDDPSSSYQCSDSSGEVNYLVTFCPTASAAAVRRK